MENTSRRDFLKVSTAAVAGSAVVAGAVTQAVAAKPIADNNELARRYAAWLFMELKLLRLELFPNPGQHSEIEQWWPADPAAIRFHYPEEGKPNMPAKRARQVLSAVGVSLEQEGCEPCHR